MPIYLVQHGKAFSKEQDADRSLNPEGIAETRSVAATLAKRRVPVTTICHSGKKRAVQTAELIAEALGCTDVKQLSGLQPNDDVSAMASALDPASHTLYVGHLPFMDRMAGYLITGDDSRKVVKFQNSAVVCLDKTDETDHWLVDWMLVPSFIV
ncbi:phosphohistidine phosphatase SixA [Hahella sp. CCB-MM4]|uniref:phosphohistidine phosphatase SixA n=1 Tax=Hahella sp. (strain CCB-MM4) TaxID=1926491 RepID=UPI000B9BF596|nr:phosphohistidine phosphatase SixA [Hahella sp. CCB-MM4]OZG74044.1 phosphohistidine phosphatase SixA [Hahella sp. CCB-MM4]